MNQKIMNARITLIFILLSVFCFSCKKETALIEKGEVEFCLQKIESNLKSTKSDPKISYVLVSIENSLSVKQYDLEKIGLIQFGDSYISKSISLEAGSYKLTEFAVLDSASNVVYVTPIAGSPMAYLVNQPLSIDFTILKDQMTNIAPEVLSIDNALPADFGYPDFLFDIKNSFLLIVFIYNDVTKNFEITSSNLTVSDGTSTIYSKALNAEANLIPVLDGTSNYILKIEKNNYLTYIDTFTKAELIAAFKSPISVILQPDLFAGLVAYYPFNGNANDESGNGNNGIVDGATLTSDRHGNANSAYLFNGANSDYISVPNSSILQITGPITISAWFKTSGVMQFAAIICKSEELSPRSGYIMDIDDNYHARTDIMYVTPTSQSVISLNTVTDNLWHHTVAVYDGSEIRLYMDDILNNQKTYSSGMLANSQPLLIGWDQNTWLSTRHFTGIIDDIRIYSRALNESEIEYLYNSE